MVKHHLIDASPIFLTPKLGGLPPLGPAGAWVPCQIGAATSPQCGQSNKHSPQACLHSPGRQERIQLSPSSWCPSCPTGTGHSRGSKAQALIPCWALLHNRVEKKDINCPSEWLVLPNAPGLILSGKKISNRRHLLGSLTATLGCTAPSFPVSPRSTVRPRESRSLRPTVSRIVVTLPRLSSLQKAQGPMTQGPATSSALQQHNSQRSRAPDLFPLLDYAKP